MNTFTSDLNKKNSNNQNPKIKKVEHVSVEILNNVKDHLLWPAGHGRPAVMKLSVATFRAGTERLNALMQHRQNRRTSASTSRAGPVLPVEEDQEALLRRVNSLDFSDFESSKENEPRTPRSKTILGIFEVSLWNTPFDI